MNERLQKTKRWLTRTIELFCNPRWPRWQGCCARCNLLSLFFFDNLVNGLFGLLRFGTWLGFLGRLGNGRSTLSCGFSRQSDTVIIETNYLALFAIGLFCIFIHCVFPYFVLYIDTSILYVWMRRGDWMHSNTYSLGRFLRHRLLLSGSALRRCFLLWFLLFNLWFVSLIWDLVKCLRKVLSRLIVFLSLQLISNIIIRRIVETNEKTRIYTFFFVARFLGFLASAPLLEVVLDFSTVPSSAVFCSYSSFSARWVWDEMIDYYLWARLSGLLWLLIFLAGLCLRFLFGFKPIRLGLNR